MLIVYALGTDTVLVLLAAGASIFWAAAMLLLTTLMPRSRRDSALNATAFLCAATTVGMLVGATITPGHFGAPIWRQTEIVELGPQRARIAVEPALAAYIRDLQRAAFQHGFEPGMPLVDLSALGPGTIFALGGQALGGPWLHVQFSRGPAQPRAILSRVPQARLHQAWLITGTDLDLPRTILASQGIELPTAYEEVGRASRSDVGWTQILWKPRM